MVTFEQGIRERKRNTYGTMLGPGNTVSEQGRKNDSRQLLTFPYRSPQQRIGSPHTYSLYKVESEISDSTCRHTKAAKVKIYALHNFP